MTNYALPGPSIIPIPTPKLIFLRFFLLSFLLFFLIVVTPSLLRTTAVNNNEIMLSTH